MSSGAQDNPFRLICAKNLSLCHLQRKRVLRG
jgi:hypothetical protein